MSTYTIANPVPTPEEMGEILGLSSDRVKAVRRIMAESGQPTPSSSDSRIRPKGAAKKSRRVRAKK